MYNSVKLVTTRNRYTGSNQFKPDNNTKIGISSKSGLNVVTRGIIPLVKPLITSLLDFKGLRGVKVGLWGNSIDNEIIVWCRGVYEVKVGINKIRG